LTSTPTYKNIQYVKKIIATSIALIIGWVWVNYLVEWELHSAIQKLVDSTNYISGIKAWILATALKWLEYLSYEKIKAKNVEYSIATTKLVQFASQIHSGLGYSELLKKLLVYIPNESITFLVNHDNGSWTRYKYSNSISITKQWDRWIKRIDYLLEVISHELVHTNIRLTVDEEIPELWLYSSMNWTWKKLFELCRDKIYYVRYVKWWFSWVLDHCNCFLKDVNEFLAGFYSNTYFQEWVFQIDDWATAWIIRNYSEKLTNKNFFHRLDTPQDYQEEYTWKCLTG
jgi:hypothetical protein